MRHLFRVCASDPKGTIGEDAPTRVFYFFEA